MRSRFEKSNVDTTMKFLCILCVIYSLSVSAFSQSSNNNKLTYFLTTSFSRSLFKPNTIIEYTIKCPELKFGITFKKKFNKIGINAGIIPAIRFSTRYRALVSNNPNPSSEYLQDYTFLESSRKMYASRRFFLEVPITADYSLIKNKLYVHVGLSSRFYQKLSSDMLDRNLNDLGMLFMLRGKPAKGIDISIDYFKSIKRFNKSSYSSNTKTYDIVGSYIQISFHISAFGEFLRIKK